MDAINTGTSGLLTAINRQLSQRGFTNSGTTGLNTQQIEAGRVGQIGQLGSNMYGQSLNDAMNFAFKNPSNTTTTVAPGNTGTGALSGGLASLMTSLNQAMAQGGS
jgi:hypothetical protein